MALDISGLSVPAPSEFGTALKNLHLTVRKGEVLGVGGVAGNGQDELLAVLSGEVRTAADAVKLHGKPMGSLARPSGDGWGFSAHRKNGWAMPRHRT